MSRDENEVDPLSSSSDEERVDMAVTESVIIKEYSFKMSFSGTV